MKLTQIDLGDALKLLGHPSLGALLKAIQEGKTTADEVNLQVERGIMNGEVRTEPGEELPLMPQGAPMELAFREADQTLDAVAGPQKGARSKSDATLLIESGAVGMVDRLLHEKTDAYVNLGLAPSSAKWAALNLLSHDSGDVGRVARSVRLGWVNATMSNVTEHGSEEEKLRFRDMKRGGRAW